MDLYIKGDITSNDNAWIYDWLELDCTTPNMVAKTISQCKNGEQLNVYINSCGGDVFAGAEIYTSLANYSNVKIHIVGFAGSMASVIAMAGYCEMSPVSQMMIHNVSSSASGDYRTMEHHADVLKNASETIAQAYINKSGMSKSEIKSIMDNETWLSPQKALELHLIDNIMNLENNTQNSEPIKMVASYNKIPMEFISKMQKKRQEALLNLELLKLKGEVEI